MTTPTRKTGKRGTAGKRTRKTVGATRRSSRKVATQQVTRQTEPNSTTQHVKRTRVEDFTPAERIAAVTAALTANSTHPTGKRAYDAACASLGVTINKSTLSDWLILYRSTVEPTLAVIPIEQTIQDQRDKTLGDMVKARDIAIQQLLDVNKAKDANYRDNGVVAGILDDHIEAAASIRPSLATAATAWDRIASQFGLDVESIMKRHTTMLQDQQMKRLMQDNQAMLSPGDND